MHSGKIKIGKIKKSHKVSKNKWVDNKRTYILGQTNYYSNSYKFKVLNTESTYVHTICVTMYLGTTMSGNFYISVTEINFVFISPGLHGSDSKELICGSVQKHSTSTTCFSPVSFPTVSHIKYVWEYWIWKNIWRNIYLFFIFPQS